MISSWLAGDGVGSMDYGLGIGVYHSAFITCAFGEGWMVCCILYDAAFFFAGYRVPLVAWERGKLMDGFLCICSDMESCVCMCVC